MKYNVDLVPSSKVVCYKCGLKLFKELAFQFRQQMKPDEIHSNALRQRDNCYYGRHCRTQYTKLTHAQKFNHACDQMKF
jgi:E3 ubiquitin-protein ligase CHFR